MTPGSSHPSDNRNRCASLTHLTGHDAVSVQGDIQMLRRIMVPLDGSALGERALTYATELAAAADATLVLVPTALSDHVHLSARWQPRRGRSRPVEAYLRNVGERLQQAGVSTEIAVLPGNTTEILLSEIKRQQPDLLVMAAVVHSGVRHMLFGSVVDAVVAGAHAPVLLVRVPTSEPTTGLSGDPVLVLLDGSTTAEAALPVARELARVL